MDLDKMLPKENQEMDVNYTLDFTNGVSQYLKGNKRLEEESYSDYRIRLKNEKKILKMYLRGRPVQEEPNFDYSGVDANKLQ